MSLQENLPMERKPAPSIPRLVVVEEIMSELRGDDSTGLDYSAKNCNVNDLDLFFSTDKADEQRAKQICEGCPVKTQCLEAALQGNEKGVWGGTTEKERRIKMRGTRWILRNS